MHARIEADWRGCVAVVAASGPSLSLLDTAHLAAIRACACASALRVIAVNDTWRLLPWADMLYAADLKWWQHHGGVPDFPGEKWTSDKHAAHDYRLRHAAIDKSAAGYSLDPARIHGLGGQSGGQAVNIALLRGAERVLLLGFDMQATGGRKHWFGAHPKPLDRMQDFAGWRRAMDAAWPAAAVAGKLIVNCSRETALRAYPRLPLEAALAECLPVDPPPAALPA